MFCTNYFQTWKENDKKKNPKSALYSKHGAVSDIALVPLFNLLPWLQSKLHGHVGLLFFQRKDDF